MDGYGLRHTVSDQPGVDPSHAVNHRKMLETITELDLENDRIRQQLVDSVFASASCGDGFGLSSRLGV